MVRQNCALPRIKGASDCGLTDLADLADLLHNTSNKKKFQGIGNEDDLLVIKLFLGLNLEN
jgi:hypothetical protein